jgi:putative ABC transport system permease protein
MGVISYKIWSDLWKNKARTLQVVLIIAMGAFAIGMIIGTRTLVIAGMTEIWQASSPSMINLWVDPPIDDEGMAALKEVDGVADAEGFITTNIEWRLSPDDRWSAAGLIARNDYEDQRYGKLDLVGGDWPREKVFALEQGHDTYFGIPEGGKVYIRINDRERVVRIGGLLSNPTANPPAFGGTAQFYTSRDYFGDLTGDRNFNRILAGAPAYDEEVVTEVADRMQDKLEKQDRDSGGTFPGRVSDPNKHFFQDVMDGIFSVLGVMSALALILGSLLVYNTVSALIAQQVDQIGIMKAIGATTGQILRLYLLTVFVYGFLALLIAVPLGAIGAYAMNVFLVSTFNADPGSFTVAPVAVLAQVAIALLAPLLASLVPVFIGARITVREAISTYGLNASISLLDRLFAEVQRISRLVLLTISNTFRHKGRVILTQITLVLSGLIFMMVISARDSAAYTFSDVLFSILRFNINLAFEKAERINRVEPLTLAYPDVKAVEMWNFDGATLRPAGQPESDDDEGSTMFGVPLPTTLYGPQMRVGRWLQPEDTFAVVLNQELAEKVGVGVGDWVTFNHGIRGETTWQVVGLLFDPIFVDSAHVPRDIMLRALNTVDKASTIWIQTVKNDPDSEAVAAENLREYYDQHQLKVSPQSLFGADTASQITAQVLNNFGVIITLLAVMAIVIGLVGSIALSGVLSLNVLERRREIGVMRAIGASSRSIFGMFIGEGLILGLLSWGIATPLSIPAGQLMTKALGAALQGEIIYKYTPAGALIWLVIITILSIVASFLPARGATRISVRESLHYQ